MIITKESEKTLFLFVVSVMSARSAFHEVTLAPSVRPSTVLMTSR
ncbi:MAG TPA: hypothetical protein VLX56_04575 [Nitrososphaerales archaeon]|nr:hypothetical protein [Nitrososphaerales archaeon]